MDVQRQGRWNPLKVGAVEAYLKPGLVSMMPDQIAAEHPRFLKTWKPDRIDYLWGWVTLNFDGPVEQHPHYARIWTLFPELNSWPAKLPTDWGFHDVIMRERGFHEGTYVKEIQRAMRAMYNHHKARKLKATYYRRALMPQSRLPSKAVLAEQTRLISRVAPLCAGCTALNTRCKELTLKLETANAIAVNPCTECPGLRNEVKRLQDVLESTNQALREARESKVAMQHQSPAPEVTPDGDGDIFVMPTGEVDSDLLNARDVATWGVVYSNHQRAATDGPKPYQVNGSHSNCRTCHGSELL